MKIIIGRHSARHLGLSIVIAISFAILCGCAATKPNISIIDKNYIPPRGNETAKNFLAARARLAEISSKNQLLATELGKLPELQDGVSLQEVRALDSLVKLYDENPPAFDRAFEEMFKIGIPEIRKYCSALQALFWLAEDNNLSDEHITKYDLPTLLSLAWQEKISLTDDQVLQIIEGIKDKDRQDQFLQDIENGVDEATIEKIVANYRYFPNTFSWSARKIIRAALASNPRWGDVDAIIDRLNAPELLDFYIDKNIIYKHIIPSFHRSPHSVINEKYGDCDDLAYFGKTVLTKAGYDVFGRIVGDETRRCHIGLGIRLEDGSYFLAVNFDQSGNHMSGPYKTVLELDKALGYGWRFLGRGAFIFDWL